MTEQIGPELARRQKSTEKLLALFRARPLEWINAETLLDIAGVYAWRTRVSEARKVFKREFGNIENKQIRKSNIVVSLYRYVPYTPLGREAGTHIDQKSLF